MSLCRCGDEYNYARADGRIAKAKGILFHTDMAQAVGHEKIEPSHVLKAVGLSDDETFQTIRLGLGRSTQYPEQIADFLIEGVSQLKSG